MDQLNKTLAEQLMMTTLELEKRKALLGMTKEDEKLLKEFKPLFTKYLDGIIKNFYDKQTRFPEIAQIIGDAETMRRLQSAMRRYIIELFDGIYDLEYVNKRLRIGKVHQRIGVSHKLFIASIRSLEDILQDTVMMHQFGENGLKEASQLKKAISKILMLDTQLVLDTYIASLVSEVELAKDELHQYANSLEGVIKERTVQLEEMSSKDMLINIYNQRAFYEHLRRELSAAERYGESLSICYFDLNKFKQLNDSEGHQSGDAVLALVGSSLRTTLRETDIPCRYGRDESVVIFPRTNTKEARLVTERIIEEFKKINKTSVSFSAGICETGPEEFVDMDSLVKLADENMYKSKAKSKKRAGYYITV